MSESDELSLWARAYRFADERHAGQERKYTGEPYVWHCEAVARMVQQRTDDEEIAAAALLHDTLEDTETTAWDLQEAFGFRVACLVQELTDVYTKEAYPDLNRAERKKREAERLGRITPDAKLIKLCDLIDNTSTIVQYDPGFAKVYLREKADILEAMGF